MIESLEMRTLFSALPVPLDPTLSLPAQSAAVHAVEGPPVIHVSTKLHLVAGVPFTGQLGFYASPVLDPPLAYSASIDWGDGNTSAATLQYGVQGSTGGYQITGSHTYSKAGQFKIEITFTSGPIAEPGRPTPNFLQLIETIFRKAVVAAAYQNSAGGVTIGEIAGQSFTADLGSFSTIAPATQLRAAISWGDGASSNGTLTPAGVIGLDVLQFTVSGTHNFTQPGTYPIHVVVTRSGRGTTRSHIASIISTATVTASAGSISLAGTINGNYATPLTNPDAGLPYDFTGSGSAGALGDVAVTGNVLLPGFIASGTASGTLTLTNSQGSVTLDLIGPSEASFGPFPSTLSYTITQASGIYAGDTGNGTITVTLTPGSSETDPNLFTFAFA